MVEVPQADGKAPFAGADGGCGRDGGEQVWVARGSARLRKKLLHKLFTAPETPRPQAPFNNTIQCMSYGVDFKMSDQRPAPNRPARCLPHPCLLSALRRPLSAIRVRNRSVCGRQRRPPRECWTLLGTPRRSLKISQRHSSRLLPGRPPRFLGFNQRRRPAATVATTTGQPLKQST